MLSRMVEYSKYLEINGFRSVKTVAAEALMKSARKNLPSKTEIQFFSADLIATWEHLYFAVLDALNAFKTERNISKSVAIETLLYASAQRQIKKAIDLIGVKQNTTDLAVIIIGESPEAVQNGLEVAMNLVGAEPDPTVLDLSQSKTQRIIQAFNILELEFDTVATGEARERALVDLVVEHMALLSTQL